MCRASCLPPSPANAQMCKDAEIKEERNLTHGNSCHILHRSWRENISTFCRSPFNRLSLLLSKHSKKILHENLNLSFIILGLSIRVGLNHINCNIIKLLAL